MLWACFSKLRSEKITRLKTWNSSDLYSAYVCTYIILYNQLCYFAKCQFDWLSKHLKKRDIPFGMFPLMFSNNINDFIKLKRRTFNFQVLLPYYDTLKWISKQKCSLKYFLLKFSTDKRLQFINWLCLTWEFFYSLLWLTGFTETGTSPTTCMSGPQLTVSEETQSLLLFPKLKSLHDFDFIKRSVITRNTQILIIVKLFKQYTYQYQYICNVS